MFHYITFLSLLIISAQSARTARQSCECQAGEEPKCGCQVVPTNEPGKSFQMLCSCSPPVPPKCICRETPSVSRSVDLSISQVTASPAPSSSSIKCVDICKRSCIEPCSRLSSPDKCDKVCSDACSYSCSKQEKIGQTKDSFIGEYKFILPSANPPPPHPSPVPPPPPPAAAIIVGNSITSPPLSPLPLPPLPPTPLLPPPSPKFCTPDCLPDCNFVCVSLKPTLKLITDFMDGKSNNPTACQSNCGETCIKVCGSAGVTLTECASNCGTACSETCGLVVKKKCVKPCLPDCDEKCIQIQTEIAVGAVIPQPAIIVTGTSSPPAPALIQKCTNECSVACESQCGVNTLSGPQCLAACQTTCYPVCQAKYRRKHSRQMKKKE